MKSGNRDVILSISPVKFLFERCSMELGIDQIPPGVVHVNTCNLMMDMGSRAQLATNILVHQFLGAELEK